MKSSKRSATATILLPQNTTICTPPTIYYCLVSAAAITLRFQRYTALQMKNSVRIISAINPVTTENMDDSCLQPYCREAMHRAAPTN